MEVNPKIRIEDAVEDVLGKAMRGRGFSSAALAEMTQLDVAAIERALAGDLAPGILPFLAHALELNSEALIELAQLDAAPPIQLPEELVLLNTAHPVPGYQEMTVNSYALMPGGDDSSAILFDAGSDAAGHRSFFSASGRQLSKLFLTHTHHDHVAAYADLVDETVLTFSPQNETFADALPVRAGQSFLCRDIEIVAIETSGHSPGGMSYQIHGLKQPVVVVGDAIFCRSIGKVPEERYGEALAMIEDRLLGLPEETILCPGHGPLTTVGHEKRHNPFFRLA